MRIRISFGVIRGFEYRDGLQIFSVIDRTSYKRTNKIKPIQLMTGLRNV